MGRQPSLRRRVASGKVDRSDVNQDCVMMVHRGPSADGRPAGDGSGIDTATEIVCVHRIVLPLRIRIGPTVPSLSAPSRASMALE
jgi:hypothetical protein